MKDAEVVEIDTVYNVFASPKHPFSRQLVNYTINLELPKRLFREKGKRLLKIVYRGERAEEPVISDIIKHFGVDINILHGKIEYISDQPIGILVVHIDGNKDVITAAEEYLKTRVPEVEVLNE